jgi:hypothetical protein
VQPIAGITSCLIRAIISERSCNESILSLLLFLNPHAKILQIIGPYLNFPAYLQYKFLTLHFVFWH